MKKGHKYSGTVTEVKFPNKGVVRVEAGIDQESGELSTVGDNGGEVCIVKNVVAGQRVSFIVNKKKGDGVRAALRKSLQNHPTSVNLPAGISVYAAGVHIRICLMKNSLN